MKKGILSWSIVAILGACGGSEPGPGSGASSLKSPNAFCEAWGKAACNPGVVDICGSSDVKACVASQQRFCNDILPNGYDPKYAQECIDAVKAAYADADLSNEELGVVLQLEEPCHRLIKGFGDQGDACDKHTDCNTLIDLECVIKAGATEGTCQVPVEVGGGESCDGADQICGEGFFCNGENCISHKRSGAACTYDAECAPEDRCDATTDAMGELQPGECVARLEDSSDCTAAAQCQSNLCATRGATEGVCVSRVRLSAETTLCENLR